MHITFTVNGRLVAVDADPALPLLTVLRDELNLTGTKQGCDMEGECGACTVLVDGEAVRSCLWPVAKAASRSITTIEGLGSPAQPHPLQSAFLAAGAVQCGYCTPGMLLAAKALLDRRLDPSPDEIITALEGNLCRCTGYVKIIQAVQAAAAAMRAVHTAPQSHGLLSGPADLPQADASQPMPVGGSLAREDGWARVSGATRYVEDMRMPGMLHMAVARSPHHHARLLALDCASAQAVPGVLRVLTATDIPGENSLGGYSVDEHLLARVGGKVRMIGDPIALVVASSTEAARQGAAALQAEFALLPHRLGTEAALDSAAVQVHSEGNLLASDAAQRGDVTAAMGGAAVSVQGTYQTAMQAHMSLEREAVLAYLDEAGRLTVLGGNHEPHWGQGYLATILGLPPEQVRVITPPMGGSFGGKQDLWPLAAAALAAYHLRVPVRLAYTRREVLQATSKRHPYTCRVSLGASADGTLAALRFAAELNTGAYDSAGRFITDYAVMASVGPYRWQAVESTAASIYSNATKAGQFRGFGAPQPVFAVECLLDELAQALPMDPLALRLRNALADDEVTSLGYQPLEPLGYRAVLAALQPDYEAMRERVACFNADQEAGAARRRGVGLAGMWYRFGKYGRPFSRAWAELGLDGEITFYASSSDYGQGVATVFSQLAAQGLGLPRGAFHIVNADTARTPDGDITGASRSTYWVGGAVLDAGRRLRALILSTAAELLDCPADELTLTPGAVCGLHSGCQVPLRAVAADLARAGYALRVQGEMDLSAWVPGHDPHAYLPMFLAGAQCAEVEVDRRTGAVQVLAISAAHDLGKAINPRDVEGQIEGAIMMGLGTALMEEYLPGATQGFGDYLIPSMRSTPRINVHIVEVPSRHGPLGAKGLGEAALLPTAPALVNAISRAAGVRLRSLPVTAERVLLAIRDAEGAGHD